MARQNVDDIEHPGDARPAALRVFMDLEFTDLTSDAEVISLAFVSDDLIDTDTGQRRDERLYIELADWNRGKASLFVRETVVPLLGLAYHHPEALPQAAAAERITQWLSDLRGGDLSIPIVLLSDSSWDWPLLLGLFPIAVGAQPWADVQNVTGRLITQELMSGRQQRIFDEAQEDYFRQRGHRLGKRAGERHHALVDALALKTAFREAMFDGGAP